MDIRVKRKVRLILITALVSDTDRDDIEIPSFKDMSAMDTVIKFTKSSE